MCSTIYVLPQLKEMKLGFVMQWEISSNLQPFKVSLRLLYAKESRKHYFLLGLLISILLDKSKSLILSQNSQKMLEPCTNTV